MSTTQQAVRPIETHYAGCLFRSRLEARYAVFFDALGLRWEYEAEGYETPAGRYLPDFLLRMKYPVLFEVKPETLIEGHSDPRWEHVSRALGIPHVAAYGLPRQSQLDPYAQPGWGHYQIITPEGGGDIHYAFCECLIDGTIGLEYAGRIERTCRHPECDRRPDAHSTLRLSAAYDAARSHRFGT